MPDTLEARLSRIESALGDLRVAVAELRHVADEAIEDLRAIDAEVGGAPTTDTRLGRLTLRARVHALENDRAAALAARAAVETARAMRDQAWSRAQKIALFAIASVSGVVSILTHLWR